MRNPLGKVPIPDSEQLRLVLARVAIRTVDGVLCWCLKPNETVHRPGYKHDHRCVEARRMM